MDRARHGRLTDADAEGPEIGRLVVVRAVAVRVLVGQPGQLWRLQNRRGSALEAVDGAVI